MDIMQDPLVIEATKELCQAFWRRAQCRRPQSSWFEIERCDKEIEVAEQRQANAISAAVDRERLLGISIQKTQGAQP